MKFWQKATLLFIAVTLCGTLCISAAYLQKSAEMNETLALASRGSEYGIIHTSLATKLNAASAYFNAWNANNIAAYLKPYSGYYSQQGIYFQLSQEQKILYSDFSYSLLLDASTESLFFVRDDTRYLAYQDTLSLHDGQAFTLTIFWNLQYLAEYRDAMMRFSAIISAFSTLAIGFVGFILMRHLTKPLRDLGAAAQRIAAGEYQGRVRIDTKDEIGQFAQTFNVMADSVERQLLEMDALVKDRQQFTDHISHEIRTPITAMIGYSQVLMHARATEADKQKAAEYIGQQSMRLKRLSEKLLNLSRLQYDTVDLRSVDIAKALHAAMDTLHNQFLGKNIRVKIDMPAVAVLGDAVLLETLFQNLLENAIHASAQDQTIEMSGTTHEQLLRVAIQDHGIGIEPEDLAAITEPFMRVDEAHSRLHGGVGIGLALCKRICELHHTRLIITSVPGSGTTIKFDFTIP